MALDAFTRGLTAQQIVRAADLDAGSPWLYLDSGSEALTAPAYVRLQAILDEIALNQDSPFQNDRLTITVADRLTELPSDFWRATFTEAYIYDQAGNRLPLRIMGEGDFHASLSDAGTFTGMPEAIGLMLNRGSANGGTPEGVVIAEPSPDRAYEVELPYQPLALPLGAITSVPWYPHSLYLIKCLACELFTNQDDSRFMTAQQERDRLERRIQRSQHGPGMRNARLAMNPEVFRRPVRL
jgi:hypothetical protein